jgi:hypothetical protein
MLAAPRSLPLASTLSLPVILTISPIADAAIL